MGKRESKFRVGQVIAYRDVDSGWEYDIIVCLNRDLRRAADGNLTDKPTAYLKRSEQRRKVEDLRPLSPVEKGQAGREPQVGWLIERGGLCLGFCEHRFI